MRLNLLPSVTVFDMHRDSAPRAHIALTTNPDCFLASGDGQAHHVPADGNLYVFDTTLPHTAFNASREDRMHITISLADEEK
jgi:aspartyl/asparaginyl beta-hydroxylase (cupin superfamily)